MPRLSIEAEGSALGAGGKGAGFSWTLPGAVVGLGAEVEVPPQPQAASQQPASQLAAPQQRRSPKRSSSNSTTGRR